MSCAHPRRQVNASVYAPCQLLGLLTTVHNRHDARILHNFLGQLLHRERIVDAAFHHHTEALSHHGKVRLGTRDNRTRLGCNRRADHLSLLGCRLSGCTVQNRRAELLSEQSQHSPNRIQQPNREGLNFIEDYNTVGDTVQFAAAGLVCGIKALEELHTSSDNDWSVPVLASPLVRERLRIEIEAAVMLYDVFSSQHASIDLCRLLDDAGVGNDNDDPFQVVLTGVMQSESQAAQGLTAAGWYGECELAGREQSSPQTFGEHVGSHEIDRSDVNAP